MVPSSARDSLFNQFKVFQRSLTEVLESVENLWQRQQDEQLLHIDLGIGVQEGYIPKPVMLPGCQTWMLVWTKTMRRAA